MGYPLLRTWFATKKLVNALFARGTSLPTTHNLGALAESFMDKAYSMSPRGSSKSNSEKELAAERELTAHLQQQVIRAVKNLSSTACTLYLGSQQRRCAEALFQVAELTSQLQKTRAMEFDQTRTSHSHARRASDHHHHGQTEPPDTHAGGSADCGGKPRPDHLPEAEEDTEVTVALASQAGGVGSTAKAWRSWH